MMSRGTTDKERYEKLYSRQGLKWHPVLWFQYGVWFALLMVFLFELVMRTTLWGARF